MCFLTIHWRVLDNAPLLLASNREESFERPSLPPVLDESHPRVLAPGDARAGGTWLGVNQHRLLVALTNRPSLSDAEVPRSRGLLCRELLRCESAEEACDYALAALSADPYSGLNLALLDPRAALVISHDPHPTKASVRVAALAPGRHFLTNGDLDDALDPRQSFAAEILGDTPPRDLPDFVSRSRDLLRTGREPESGRTIVLRGEDRGTVSSSILAVTDAADAAIYLFAPGAPDQVEYEDHSPQLRALLAQG